MVYFSVSGNSLTGNLPASMSEWKYVADFEVNANKFDGQLPAINYAAITHTDMSGCFLLDQPVTNRFSCPFPPGVTEKCLKNNDGGWVPITNADCISPTPPPKPTPKPTPPPPTPTPPPPPTLAGGYSCNATVGQCRADPLGNETAAGCIGSCKCVAPRNCGTYNNTVRCGKLVAGCTVCAACCFSFKSTPYACNGCFSTPVAQGGCGGK